MGLCLWVLALPTTADELISPPLELSFPADTLRENLLRLGQSTKTSIFFAEELVADLRVPAIKNAISVDEVLENWTSQHCLSYEYVRPNFVALSAASQCQQQVTETVASETQQSAPLTMPKLGLEEIVVRDQKTTGSRLRQMNYGPISPLDVIDNEEIRMSGFQSIAEILRYVPAVSGNSTSTLISNGGDGTATITMRGLPASNTLVLLNGRRMSPNAFTGQAIDLNTLPLPMIERVEILKDGVSAIYGSDAVAGVVNIITKEARDGIELDLYRGTSSRSDLDTEQFSIQAGYQGDNWSTLWGLSHYDQDGVFSRDRARSLSSDDRLRGGIDKRSSATAPAYFYFADLARTLNAGQSGVQPGDFRAVTPEDRFEYREFTSSIVPSSRQSAFGSIDWQFESGEADLDLFYTRNEADAFLAPVPIFTGFEDVALELSPLNPFNPFDETLTDIRRRVVELPPRRQINHSETFRAVASLAWQFENWRLTSALQHDQTLATERRRNGINAAALASALGANCNAPCVPINLLGPVGSINQEMLDFVGLNTRSRGKSVLQAASVEFDWQRDGRLQELVAGVEYRRETLRVNPDPALSAGLSIGGGNMGPTEGAREIFEAYTEVLVNLLNIGGKSLDAQLAARYADYNDFGSVYNPRIALHFHLHEHWTLRATGGRGFRAPSLRQLHGAAQQSFEQLTDPCSQPELLPDLAGCQGQADSSLNQFLTITGGNTELKPEDSRTFSLALNYKRNWSRVELQGALSRYAIRQKNVVDSSAQFVINQNARTGSFAERISRDTNGNLNRVSATLQNIGSRDVSGIDLSLSAKMELKRYGVLQIGMDATHIQSFTDRFDPDSPRKDQSGRFSDEASGGLGGLPDWKLNFALNWQQRGWQIGYNIYYISGLKERVPLSMDLRRIGAWNEHNANVSFLGPQTYWIRVSLGLSNLFDRKPPFSAAAFNDSYDGRTYDITGRYGYLKLERSF